MRMIISILLLVGLAYSHCPWEDGEDPNPNKPQFTVHEYYLQIPIDIPENTTIVQVNATDMDVNDTLIYSLGKCSEVDFLLIGELTGIISINKTFEDSPGLELVCDVKVRDRELATDPVRKVDHSKLTIFIVPLKEYT